MVRPGFARETVSREQTLRFYPIWDGLNRFFDAGHLRR